MISFIPVTVFISTHPDPFGQHYEPRLRKGTIPGRQTAMIGVIAIKDFCRKPSNAGIRYLMANSRQAKIAEFDKIM